MPGHNHHFSFFFQEGDLNLETALFNWMCPVDKHDGEDITVIAKR